MKERKKERGPETDLRMCGNLIISRSVTIIKVDSFAICVVTCFGEK